MGYVIEDGKGSTVKANVFEKRLRTIDVQCSAMNQQSAENASVFDVGAVYGMSSGNSSYTVLHVTNNDPINMLVVDRIYVQYLVQSFRPPTGTGSFFAIGIGTVFNSGGAMLTPVNENRESRELANVTVVTGSGLFLGGTFTQINKNWASASISFASPVEMIIQGSDGNILGYLNTMEIQLTNVNIGTGIAMATMRFAMVPPGQIG